MEAPDVFFFVEIESEQAIETRRCQENRLLESENLMAVLQIAVFMRRLNLEAAVITKKFVARGDQDIVTADCNAA